MKYLSIDPEHRIILSLCSPSLCLSFFPLSFKETQFFIKLGRSYSIRQDPDGESQITESNVI